MPWSKVVTFIISIKSEKSIRKHIHLTQPYCIFSIFAQVNIVITLLNEIFHKGAAKCTVVATEGNVKAKYM